MASELQLLASPDDALLTALIVTAKACVGEARMLQRAAVAPLAALLREASLGELPQSAWAARMDAIPRAEGAECITAGELMVTLLPQVPSDAHARRLRAALAWLEREGGESPAGLVILLQGTTLLRGAQVDLPLLRSIYEALKRVALPPLHLLGLVQQPLLLECQRALGIDEWFSPPPAEPTDHLRQTETGGSVTPDAEETDSAHVGEMARAAFLEAAALARLGDQRGSKHGCVLVDGASGNVLGRGYNHQVRCIGIRTSFKIASLDYNIRKDKCCPSSEQHAPAGDKPEVPLHPLCRCMKTSVSSPCPRVFCAG